MKALGHLLALAAVCACVGVVSHAKASMINDAHELSYVNNGIASSDADKTLYSNDLVGTSFASITAADGPAYTPKNLDFGSSYRPEVASTGHSWGVISIPGNNLGGRVPDGGSTLAFLGLSLLLATVLRAKLHKA